MASWRYEWITPPLVVACIVRDTFLYDEAVQKLALHGGTQALSGDDITVHGEGAGDLIQPGAVPREFCFDTA